MLRLIGDDDEVKPSDCTIITAEQNTKTINNENQYCIIII
jgi:hypothetical protein